MNFLLMAIIFFCFHSHLFCQDSLEDQISRITSHAIIQSYFEESAEIVILSNEVCNAENCHVKNDEGAKPIVFLKKEDAFQKGVGTFITIQEIKKTAQFIEAKVVTAKGRVFIIIV